MQDERLQIRYDLTRSEYEAALRYVAQRLVRQASRGWLPIVLMLVGAVCGGIIGYAYLELANGYRGPHRQWAWWGIAAFFLVWIVMAWHQQFRAGKVFSGSVADDGSVLGPQEFTVTPEALVHRHRSAMTHLAWPALKSIEEKGGNVLIFTDNAAFYMVPGRVFADTRERDAWIDLLRSRSGPDPATSGTADVLDAPSAGLPAASAPAPSGGTAAEIGLLRNFRAGMRLAMLQRVERGDLVATAEAFAVLVAFSIAVSVLLGVAAVGIHGEFNYYELPRALMVVPLVLALGLLVARVNGDPKAVLVLAVALVAAGIVVTIVMGALGLLVHHKILATAGRLWKYIHYFTYAWWAVVIAAAVLRLAPLRSYRSLGNVAAGLLLLVLPMWFLPHGYLWVPKYDPETGGYPGRSDGWAIADERGFYAQHDALPRALAALQPERPGVADLYVITAGLYSREDVFMKEVKVIDTLFRERFDAEGRSLVLINNPKTIEQHPVATLTSLGAALRHVGKLMNREEDVLVLYVSSHGSQQHKLAVEFWPLRLASIDPAALKGAVDQSGIKWKVIVVSACYSGGFVEPLKDDHTLIITASSPTKVSFGCGNESDSTYLAKALFDEEMRKTYSFEAAFAEARKSIEQRERGEGYTPSEPQIYVGAAIRDKLTQIEQRLAGRAPAAANESGRGEGRQTEK
jgi:hypothetical protein